MHTFLDFTFLKTLPEGQVRNGFAELIKISSCAHLRTFDLLDEFCERLIETKFGRSNDPTGEVKRAADEINRAGIHEMLKLETPNLHEIGLDRVIAYGHTWSPLHEVCQISHVHNQCLPFQLTPAVPLRHGHAISIDMAYSATLANSRGLLSDKEHRRLLNLFSKAGLSMDHEDFNEDIVDKATKAILKTRDGQLRLAVPNPLGSCTFLNDVTTEEMNGALRKHKKIMEEYPRRGAGLDAFVDASDTGYTVNGQVVDPQKAAANGAAPNGAGKGVFSNGVMNGLKEVMVNGYPNGYSN
jgi:3-dehydroquinate synthase